MCLKFNFYREWGETERGEKTLLETKGRNRKVAKWDGAKRDGAKRDGAKRDGAKRDGAKWDGAKRDGAKRDGAKWDGAKWDGAKRDGAKWDVTAGTVHPRTLLKQHNGTLTQYL